MKKDHKYMTQPCLISYVRVCVCVCVWVGLCVCAYVYVSVHVCVSVCVQPPSLESYLLTKNRPSSRHLLMYDKYMIQIYDTNT